MLSSGQETVSNGPKREFVCPSPGLSGEDEATGNAGANHGWRLRLINRRSWTICSTLRRITVVPLTSTIVDAPLFRITLPREKIGKRVGHVGNTLMIRVGRALSVWLGMS